MKSKAHKSKELEFGRKLLSASKNVVFADFTGVGVESLRKLKKELKASGSAFRVIKKRLLNIVFKEQGIEFNPAKYESQVGSIFIPGELADAAGVIYKFSRTLAKEKKEFKILGAYDVAAKQHLDTKAFLVIAKLPSREALLALLVGILSAPLRQLMVAINQIAKSKEQVVEQT
jgi:large subunit ribosomal protein L10